MKLIFSLVIVVYLTQLPKKRLNNFGDFIKKVLSVLPITKVAEAIARARTEILQPTSKELKHESNEQ